MDHVIYLFSSLNYVQGTGLSGLHVQYHTLTVGLSADCF